MPKPYKIFIIYAREDAPFLDELLGHLRPLENSGRVELWCDREIDPGVEWEQAIVQKLDAADIVLMLVSAAYFKSAYIHQVEIRRAKERHRKGEAQLLPVIVRPCAFHDDPIVGGLQLLPTDGKPVSDRQHWPSHDNAWVDVVKGLKRALEGLDRAEAEKNAAAEAAQVAELRRRAEEARRAEAIAAQQQEAEAWRLANAEDTAPAYAAFLSAYPKSAHAKNARLRIKQLEQVGREPLPLGRYAAGVGGVLVLVLLLWYAPKMWKGGAQDATLQPGAMHKNPTEEPAQNYTDPLAGTMVLVKGGTFQMGGDNGDSDEKPVHSVTLSDYYIGQTEVTQAQWRAVMGSDPSYYKDCDNCPVEQVSWDDIQEFLKKLNARSGVGRYRLPTEAEWEYASHGGRMSKDYTYAGSNNIDNVAWYDSNSGSKTHPVKGKAPNELGLYDMSGNVWEWCADWYGAYASLSVRNPTGPTSGSLRVFRGGSWSGSARGCCTSRRNINHPEYRYSNLGFRLARQF